MDAKEFTPEGRRNHYLHPRLGVCILKEGMTLEEFIGSVEQARMEDAEAARREAESPPRDLASELDALKASYESRLTKLEASAAVKAR